MKKIVFLSVLLYTFCSQNLFGWGREGHDAVAYIAECNLNKKAKKIIESYLDGHSIVYYSSWMDDYRHTPEYKHTTVWHMASVDESLHYTDAVKAPEGDAVCELENAIRKLENYKALDDSTVAVNLKYIIHLVGDMHCPAHVRFPDTKIWYNVKLNGKKYTYHSLWDTQIITQCHKWHYMEWQHQLDRCSKKEKQSIMAGTPRDWFSQTATDCRHIYSIAPENSELGRDFLNENITLAEQQILKAGYRLAKVLNDLFG